MSVQLHSVLRVPAGRKPAVAHTHAQASCRDTINSSLSNQCLCMPVGKLIAVALLDSTVKVFFTDTLKFFLSLYGHKLPVLSMDISSDSTLLVTGSADKNIKIWGLDFGDCHKSLFAHADSVMQVAFVPNTHYVFSVGECPCWVLPCCCGCLQALGAMSSRILEHAVVLH